MLKEVFVVSLCFVSVGFVLFVGEPMAMALTLGVLSSMVSVAICMAYSSWFGFTVFLGYVGGLVVVFCIVLSVAPNPDLKVDFVLLGLLVFWGADFFVWGCFGCVDPLMKEFVLPSLTGLSSVSGNSFAELGNFDGFSWGVLLVFLGLVLLLGVLSVSEVSKHGHGPLVKFSKKGGPRVELV